MKLRWPVIALVITVANSVSSAPHPTKDEYVVIAGNNGKTTVPTTDTTDRPLAPIKMTEMRVKSEIALRYAHTSVITRVQNPDTRAQEVSFRMLLPDTAFISGFTMTLSGKSYKAYVKEKEEAKQIYTQAVSQGIGAAHVATKARDSNHFTVSVNVEGNTTAVFDLRYEEFLVRRHGLYNHAINLHPGALVPKMEIVVHIKESQKISTLRVPEVRTGNEVDATEKDRQNSKAVIERGTNEKEATVTFTPELSEQRRLAGIYLDKTKEKSSSEKYIGYSSDEDDQEDNEIGTVLGQFVVQYDVERPENGEILVNDGYFVHFLSPKLLKPLNKYVVFVLDTSGSMMGRKIVQLRNAMDAILSDLKPNDYYSIVEFNSDVKVHEMKEADEEPPPRYMHYSYFNSRNTRVELVPPSPATAENIAKAKIIVSRLNASGGTNIFSALDVALNLVKKENKTDSLSEVVDDTVGTTEVAQKKLTAKDKEPMIIFLTDGDPTVGETSTSRIISSISERNSGDKRVSMFSLAFGEDADRSFLRKLSLRNEGFMRHIYEAADAALQLHDFYRQVSSPLLSHVQFLYPSKQIKEGSVSRTHFRTVNEGSEVAVVGKIAEDAFEITPEISGFCSDEDGVGKKRYTISPKVVVNRTKNEHLPLERLWAYLTIKQLLDKRDASDDDQSTDENSPEKKALAIALKYEFVTPLTSLVVVKPDEQNAVDVESVDKLPNEGTIAYHSIMGPPLAGSPHNSYLASSFSSGFSLGPGKPGAPPPYFSLGNIQPLALDASHYPDALVDDEMDYDFSGPLSNAALFRSTALRRHHISSGDTAMRVPSAPRSKKSPQQTQLVPWRTGGVFKSDTGLPVSSYRYIISTPASLPTTTPKHLEFYKWTDSLLNTANDALSFNDNGTEVFLSLSSDGNLPKADGGDEVCSNSTATEAAVEDAGSVCVYLTRCYSARSISVEDYKKSYCIVNNRYAGVCCARSEVDKNP